MLSQFKNSAGEVNMKVVHCIPSLEVGGIESMSIRLLEHKFRSFEYTAVFFDGFDEELLCQIPAKSKSQLTIFRDLNFVSRFISLWKLMRDLPSEDVVVLSTWRSLKIFFILKILQKKNRVIMFHHRTYPAHIIDRISRIITYKFIRSHFCDSDSTFVQLPHELNKSVVKPFFPAKFEFVKKSYNKFCIIGRIHEHRNLPIALKLFCKLYALVPDAHLDIIGPDAGALSDVKAVITSLGINDAVTIYNRVSPFEILMLYKRYDFVISTPLSEGMGMSVAEAMSAGVIPIVGPFGEPVDYCSNGKGFILDSYNDDDLKRMAEKIAQYKSNDLLAQMSLRSAKISYAIPPCGITLESRISEII